MVGFNDGAANIQSHAHFVRFSAKKRLKHALGHGFGYSRAAITDLNFEHGWKSAGIQIRGNAYGRRRPARGEGVGFPSAIETIFE